MILLEEVINWLLELGVEFEFEDAEAMAQYAEWSGDLQVNVGTEEEPDIRTKAFR